MSGLVRANKAGCLDQCELGPTVVIYPQATWYGGVKLGDVERIIEETVIGNRTIKELEIPDDVLNSHKVNCAESHLDSDSTTESEQ